MIRWPRLLRRERKIEIAEELRARIDAFRRLLQGNNRVLELIADADEKLGGEWLFDRQYLFWLDRELAGAVKGVVADLGRVAPRRHEGLQKAFQRIREALEATVESRPVVAGGPLCLSLESIGSEQASLVGEKMARLGEIRSRLGIRIPEGFVITAPVSSRLLAAPPILESIAALSAQDADLEAISGHLSRAIHQAELSGGIRRTISRRLRHFDRRARLAIRSSAIGEDGELSFAGVHRSVMNVARGEVLEAYRQVVASLFSERALRYRKSHGEPVSGATMAVGCMEMVAAAASGVIHTYDPSDPERDTLVADAAWGLGGAVVEGTGEADRFFLSRTPPHRVVERQVALKETMHLARPEGGVRLSPVSAELRSRPCVSDAVLEELARIVLAIERHMRRPQEIEWAVDEEERIWILQARPLRMAAQAASRPEDVLRAVAAHQVILKDRGVVACRGIAAGPVVLVTPKMRPDDFPPGGVLLAQYPSPGLSTFLPRASALVTDEGSAAGHLATIARERRIPSIVHTELATSLLQPGMEVTVDAEENIIYSGTIKDLVRYGLLSSMPFGETREFRVLRSMLALIAPLHLHDPADSGFTPEGCTSYHDIIRFAHEKALQALSNLGDLGVQAAGETARRLALDVPLDLVVLDVGGGLAPGDLGDTIELDELTSEPLKLLLAGLRTTGAWSTSPAEMDFKAFMSSATRSASLTIPGTASVRRNLAIISRQYMNLSLRLGYHFNVIDGFIGEAEEDSYLSFRFVGGVTEAVRRCRRAVLITEILAHHHFVVDRKGDLVVGRLAGISRSMAEEGLGMLGRLIGFTRQLDVVLRDEDTVHRLVDRFLSGRCDAEL